MRCTSENAHYKYSRAMNNIGVIVDVVGMVVCVAVLLLFVTLFREMLSLLMRVILRLLV